MPSIPENVVPLQREVQRKIGRNLLWLQQYENLAKALVAEREVAGPIDELHNVKAQQIESFSTKSLGQVVKDFTTNYMIQTAATASSEREEGSPSDQTQSWVSISHRIELTEENFNQLKKRLDEFVKLRNDLVHHFLGKHDLWSEPGCLAADAYLDACFQQIQGHYEELKQLAKHSLNARVVMSNVMQTPEIRDLFIHGIMPGGAGVLWASSTIVKLLLEAESTRAKDGWTLLQSAIDHINKLEPEHTPKKYGCSSWRQLLQKSGQFETRKEQANPGLPTITWFRSR